jgi:hypothetical protein
VYILGGNLDVRACREGILLIVLVLNGFLVDSGGPCMVCYVAVLES